MSDPRVVLVEDNDEHAELIEFSLAQSHPNATLERFSDGAQALESLRQRPVDQAPHLVLLDLKLPGISGLELLAALRSAPETRPLCIVMFTTSNSARDRSAALEGQANAFIVKPMDYAALKERLRATFTFWLDHAVQRDSAT